MKSDYQGKTWIIAFFISYSIKEHKLQLTFKDSFVSLRSKIQAEVMGNRYIRQTSPSIIILFIVMMITSCVQPHTKAPRRILVIQSFEPEYPGYDKIEADLNHLFTSHKINPEIRSFYLDCDSYNDKNEAKI